MLRYPILIFFILGFVLWNIERFVLPETDIERRIVVSQSDIAKMKKEWQKQNGRLPAQEELIYLINRYVEDELLVRQAVEQGLASSDPVVRLRLYKNILFLESGMLEGSELEREKVEQKIKQAIAMGMQDNDPVVKRRLIQVMEAQIRSAIAWPRVTEQALTDYLLANQGRYKRPDTWTFQHVLFSRDKDGILAQHRAQRALETIQQIDNSNANTKLMGDASLIPREFNNSTHKHVVRYLGERFLAAIVSLPMVGWQGPVQSAFGWHLVRIEAHTLGDLPALESIKNRLLIDWQSDEIEKLLRQRKKSIRESYQIILEEPVS